MSLSSNSIVFRYLWITTVGLICFFDFVLLQYGQASSFPTPWTLLDVHGVAFVLLISQSQLFLFLFILHLRPQFGNNFFASTPLMKLLGLHLFTLVCSLFLPLGAFISLYVVAYFVWNLASGLLSVFFSQDLTAKLIINKNHQMRGGFTIWTIFGWICTVVLFGFIYQTYNGITLLFDAQMIYLSFPLFVILIPIISWVVKAQNGIKVPLSFYALILFVNILIIWLDYMKRTTPEPAITFLDLILNLVLVSYAFYATKNDVVKLEGFTHGKLNAFQILLILLWAQVSSMVILLIGGNYTLAGYDAETGTYLLQMLVMFLIGSVVAYTWAKRGLVSTDFNHNMTLPEPKR